MSSSLEGNKTLAAVLTAGIMAVGAGVVAEIIYAPHEPETYAYSVDLPDAEAGGEAEAVDALPLPVLLASADAAAGEGVAKKCVSCHSFEAGGDNKVGPALHGVVGREIGGGAGFAYSDALAGMDGSWDYAALDGFLADPKGWAPGTKMSFAGIGKDTDRADLILYMASMSPDAPPLPEVEAEASEAATETAEAVTEATETAAETATEAVDAAAETVTETAEAAAETVTETAEAAVVAVAGDAAAGEKVARKCKACHDFAQDGENKVGPPMWGVVGRDIAAVDGFAYSDALNGKEGVWDAASLDAFLLAPKDWAEGTKMAFSGLRKDEDRADIIAYLSSLSN